MKTYHLIGHDGSVRPGKASSEQIAAALGHTESYEDRLAIVSLKDGEVVVVPLTAAELSELRGELVEHQKVELRSLLDHFLVVTRIVDGMTRVHVPSLTIFVEEYPFADDVVRDWAVENGLGVHDRPLPASGKEWIRTCDIRLNDKSWSQAVVTLQWPSQKIDGASIVARDAELDGRPPEQVEAIRAEEMPF